MTSALHFEAYTRVGALELELELEVSAGRCLALAGPSGAGKTTVLRIISGLASPRRGSVSCGDQIWLDTNAGIDRPTAERRVGYVFQDYALFPHLCAWQNVAYGLGHVPRRRRRGLALELLERFGIAERQDARPASLSGGERQRVALARALAHAPRALLLDEPLSALDSRARASASRQLAGVLRAAGVPCLLVTHDFAEAAGLASEVAMLDAGRVVQRGTASELAACPASAFVADFTGAVVLLGTARAGPQGLTLVDLDGGGIVASTDAGRGPVAASVHPWEITVGPPGAPPTDSARNHLPARLTSATTIGNRVRMGLAGPQPLTAEITLASAQGLDLAPGTPLLCTWKATATRLATR